MFCPSCGTQVADDLRFCPTCGAAQPSIVGTGAPQQIPPGSYTPPPPLPVYIAPAQVQAATGRWIGESWRMVNSELGMFMVATLVFLVCTSVVPFILNGALTAGFYIACIRKMRGAPLDIGDLFKGFNYFVPALVTALLVGIFMFAGLLLCLLPALFVAAIFLFPYHFIIDKKMDFWPAMQASHDVVKKDYAGFIVFILAIAGVNILGVLALVIGLLVTIPMTFAAITVAYRDVVGFEPNPDY